MRSKDVKVRADVLQVDVAQRARRGNGGERGV